MFYMRDSKRMREGFFENPLPAPLTAAVTTLGVSLHSAYAFFFDTAGTLDFAPWANRPDFTITLTDSSSNIASATPGNAGSGGAGGNLGSNLLRNAGFESGTLNWTAADGAILSTVSGGLIGNCLKIIETGKGVGRAQQAIASIPPQNALIFHNINYKAGTGTGGRYRIYNTLTYYFTDNLTASASWASYDDNYFNMGTTSTILFIVYHLCASGAGTNILFDETAFQQVTEPPGPATGAAGLWAAGGWSVAAGFKPNEVTQVEIEL